MNRYLFELRQRERGNNIAEPIDQFCHSSFFCFNYSPLFAGVRLFTENGICNQNPIPTGGKLAPLGSVSVKQGLPRYISSMNDYDYDATLASDDILGLYMRASSEELP